MGPRSDERGNGLGGAGTWKPSASLQWGRAQMSAEIRTHPWRPGHGGHGASMGPRSDERGNELDRVRRAAAVVASMGPRSDERGNTTFLGWPDLSATSLQWGRAQMSAEIGQ